MIGKSKPISCVLCPRIFFGLKFNMEFLKPGNFNGLIFRDGMVFLSEIDNIIVFLPVSQNRIFQMMLLLYHNYSSETCLQLQFGTLQTLMVLNIMMLATFNATNKISNTRKILIKCYKICAKYQFLRLALHFTSSLFLALH